MLRFANAFDWLSSAATIDMAPLTGSGSLPTARVRRLVSSAATRLRRQEASARACTKWAGFEALGGHDYDLAGESVTESVERRLVFAGGGFGAGGVLRVGSVDFDAVWC